MTGTSVTPQPVLLGMPDAGPACSTDGSCITCGDVAVALTVVAVHGADADCRDEQGRAELVATELVGPVAAGDRLLVHAGVALERLDHPETEPPEVPV